MSTAEAVDAALVLADRAWEQRAEPYESTASALRDAAAIDPDAPGVLWRQARLELARGIGTPDPEQRVRTIGRARDLAWRCAMADPVTRGLTHEIGLEQALLRLPRSRQPCASWAYLAWTRWFVEFGPDAAALDLVQLRTLSNVAHGWNEEATGHRIDWGDALLQASRGLQPTNWSGIEDDTSHVDRIRLDSNRTTQERREAWKALQPKTPEARAYRAWISR